MRVSTGRGGIKEPHMSGGKVYHLLPLKRLGRSLIRPFLFLHAALVGVHLSLQLLQTPLHTRRHLQTAIRKEAYIM